MFTEKEKAILSKYVSCLDSPIFVLKNLPEVIKGALFSRYSRSKLGLRELLLKEFIFNTEESGFSENAQDNEKESALSIEKAQKFYDRILDGYGDDSIGELGGAHVAFEGISMLAAKIIEDSRIGGSPLEKSARYVAFDEQVEGKYRYYRDPKIMSSAYGSLYEETADFLFDTYKSLVPPVLEEVKKNSPRPEEQSMVAWENACRAKALDLLRGLLPAATYTNVGIFGNGRFFESLLQKLHRHSMEEMKDLGRCMHEQLDTTIPSFVRRAALSHKNAAAWSEWLETQKSAKQPWVLEMEKGATQKPAELGAFLVDYAKDAPTKVAAMLLWAETDLSLKDLEEKVAALPKEKIEEILALGSVGRTNRRHKGSRALEHAQYLFEIISDFGSYRDMQRHRILTQERQLLTTRLGYYFPQELEGSAFETPYKNALAKAAETFEKIAEEFPVEAQYIVPLAYHIRYYFSANLRALQWIAELRSQPQGHATYRKIAQDLCREVVRVHPEFSSYFSFVDFSAPGLGRLAQELRKAQAVS